jgi:hypothetical protein
VSYVVKRPNLAAAINGQVVVGPNAAITSWTILQSPAGLNAFLRLGQSGDQIPVQEGLTWDYDPCTGPELGGLYLDLPAAAAGDLVIVVFFGSGAAALGS